MTWNICTETLPVAAMIGRKGRASLQAAKEVISLGQQVDLQTGLAHARSAFAICLASPDARGGTTAFLEKRKAKFTGKRAV